MPEESGSQLPASPPPVPPPPVPLPDLGDVEYRGPDDDTDDDEQSPEGPESRGEDGLTFG